MTSTKSGKTNTTTQWILVRELSPQCMDAPRNVFSVINQRYKHELDTYTVRIIDDMQIATDSSGKYAVAVSQISTGSPNWTSFAACFDEYRTLAMRVTVKPYRFAGGASSTVLAPIVGVVDMDTSAVLTGYTLASQYSSYKEVPGGDLFSITALMSGAENSVYQSTGSVTALWYVKIYTAGNTVSLNFANLTIERIVQFRGKGI